MTESIKKTFSQFYIDGDMQDTLAMLPLSQIEPDPNQDRYDWSNTDTQEHIKSLAVSIQKHGVRDPIKVMLTGKRKYTIVDGECRYRACKLTDIKEIPSLIRANVDSKQMSIDMLQSSVNKLALQPIELAKALQKRLDDGFTVKDLMDATGKSKSWISKRLTLLKASEIVQLLAQDGKVKDVETLNKIEKLPIEEKKEVVKRIRSGQPVKEAIKKQAVVDFSITKEQVEKILTSFGSETPTNVKELKAAWDSFLKTFED